MTRLLNTVAFRLAIGYSALVLGAVAVVSAVLYFGTVGVLSREIDSKLIMIAGRLSNHFETRGIAALQGEIEQLLTDGVDQDTEVYLLLGPNGQKRVGNLSDWPDGKVPLDQLTDQAVTRAGRPSTSRLLPLKLSGGATLVVGRDLRDVREIEQLVLRALVVGGVIGVLLAMGGADLFRRLLEHRIAAIRRTVLEIEAGDLSRRIPVVDSEDEFTRLKHDINHMLDRIEHLMNGVREVSNAIAHDLRTPLGRIRGLLDEALRPETTFERLSEAADAAIRGIDEVIRVFDKLLQIAEAESGTRRQSFQPIALREIITGVVELYDAAAEAKGIALRVDCEDEPVTLGDKELLANATANLVDNSLKYAGRTATVRVRATQDRRVVSIVVEDNGPGIPPEEREKVLTRFYRLDRSRSLPGNGLGLPIVSAISHLHGGSFSLEDGGPGLIARIVLPRLTPASLPNGNVLETARIGTAG
ncbi:MAG: HAMP domain-containing histidine kinase [Verrucomicrobia bacterium]|nr:HAMP domain-containing histidine kinase [Verrucomicrobiota bacterium]